MRAKETIYKPKSKSYFDYKREDIVALIPQGAHKILDIGSGTGNLGLALKENGKASEVVGIELCEDYAKEAGKKIDNVINEDIENLELPYPEGYFDYIICGDVLEHLIDPWSTLQKLSKYLSESGYLVASIPNIRYWRVLKDLVFFGEWEYQTAGILDKSHLRFFTRKAICQLFESTGFKIDRIIFRLAGKSRIFNFLTASIFKELLESRFLIIASKRD